MRRIFLVVALTGLLLTQALPLSSKALTNLGGIAALKCVLSSKGDKPSEDCSNAESMLLAASSLDPSNVGGYYLLGCLRYQQSAATEAIEILNRATQRMPVRDSVWVLLGRVYLALGHTDQAISAWWKVQAFSRDPGSAEAHERFGQVLVYQHDQLKAGISEYRQAIALGLDNEWVWLKIAHAMDMQGHFEQAGDLLEEKGVRGPLADAIRGNAYRARGMPEMAIRMYMRSLEQQPDNPWVYFTLGLAYEQKGDRTEAEAAWRRALQVDPNLQWAIESLRRLEESEPR